MIYLHCSCILLKNAKVAFPPFKIYLPIQGSRYISIKNNLLFFLNCTLVFFVYFDEVSILILPKKMQQTDFTYTYFAH